MSRRKRVRAEEIRKLLAIHLQSCETALEISSLLEIKFTFSFNGLANIHQNIPMVQFILSVSFLEFKKNNSGIILYYCTPELVTRVGSHVVFAWIHCTDV